MYIGARDDGSFVGKGPLLRCICPRTIANTTVVPCHACARVHAGGLYVVVVLFDVFEAHVTDHCHSSFTLATCCYMLLCLAV